MDLELSESVNLEGLEVFRESQDVIEVARRRGVGCVSGE